MRYVCDSTFKHLRIQDGLSAAVQIIKLGLERKETMGIPQLSMRALVILTGIYMLPSIASKSTTESVGYVYSTPNHLEQVVGAVLKLLTHGRPDQMTTCDDITQRK